MPPQPLPKRGCSSAFCLTSNWPLGRLTQRTRSLPAWPSPRLHVESLFGLRRNECSAGLECALSDADPSGGPGAAPRVREQLIDCGGDGTAEPGAAPGEGRRRLGLEAGEDGGEGLRLEDGGGDLFDGRGVGRAVAHGRHRQLFVGRPVPVSAPRPAGCHPAAPAGTNLGVCDGRAAQRRPSQGRGVESRRAVSVNPACRPPCVKTKVGFSKQVSQVSVTGQSSSSHDRPSRQRPHLCLVRRAHRPPRPARSGADILGSGSSSRGRMPHASTRSTRPRRRTCSVRSGPPGRVSERARLQARRVLAHRARAG